MEALEYIEQWFAQYGYWVLLIGLPLDAIALPIPPGNTTLTYTGYLAYTGTLQWLPAVASAYAGAIIGMTATYWIGRALGYPLIERYGRRLLKPAHLERTRAAYGKYGNKLLLFSYFMPGVRQFIGYFAGMMRIPFRAFALYAYSGAALWVGVFTGIGYLFGDRWQIVFAWVQQSFAYLFAGGCAALVVWLLWLWRRRTTAAASDKQRRAGGTRHR